MKKTLELIKSVVFFVILTLPSQAIGLENGLVEERCYEKPLFGVSEIWNTITADQKMLSSIVENKKIIVELYQAIQIKNPLKAEISGSKVFSMKPTTKFYISSDFLSALENPRIAKMNAQKNKSWWISQIMNIHDFISETNADSELDNNELKFLQKLKYETQLLSNIYDKVAIERFTESENNFFLGYIKSNPIQEIYLLCSYRFYNNFNADFQLKAPEDLSFILETDDTQVLEVGDQILGSRLSGQGDFSSVKNCVSTGQLTLECSIIPLSYDNVVLLILLKKLTIKERYQLSNAKQIGFSNCIISEIQNPRNIGGVQVKDFLKGWGKELQTAAVEGISTAKTSEKGFFSAFTQSLLGMAEVSIRPKAKLKSINIVTCELEFQNLNIMN